MSSCPHFWHSIRETIPTEAVSIDGLFQSILTLLRQIVDCRGDFKLQEGDPLQDRLGPEVKVHVYHVTQDIKWIRGINRVTASKPPLSSLAVFSTLV